MKAHRPRKRFGQHFLRDQGVIDGIVAAIAPKPGDRLVEIGPGEGVLTGPVLARAGEMTVIELDRDLASTLAQRLKYPDGLTIVQADALGVNFAELAKDGPIRVIGNLPYNISTPLIFHLLSFAEHIQDMVFMLQKEVVERLVAVPGSRLYGRLSVMVACHCRGQALFDVPPEAFDPPPRVDSAIVRLLPEPMSAERQALMPMLDRLVKISFGQRRKTLKKSLKGLVGDDHFQAAGIVPSARPETISLDGFLALARQIQPAG